MKVRIVPAVLAVVGLLVLIRMLGTEFCPVCSGPLAKVGTIADDISKPSRNLCVWNRSACGNVLHGADSLVCTRCWHAGSHLVGDWERSIENPNGFRRPFSPTLRAIPLPSGDSLRSRVIFTQTYSRKRFTENVTFWASNSESLFYSLRGFCLANRLVLTLQTNPITREVYVKIQ